MSGLVARQLRELVEEDERYEEGRRVALEALSGVSRRGGRRWRREDLYER